MSKNPLLQLLMGAWCALHPYRLQFGNPINGGFPNVEALLKAIAELNRWLAGELGLPPMAISAHLNHELKIPGGNPASQYNNNEVAIDFERWLEGAQTGELAPIGRIIPAGFGYPWSDHGAFRSDSEEVRKFHHDAMVLAFQMSDRVIREKAGLGSVIYWDGPDSMDWCRVLTGKEGDMILTYEVVKQMIEWKRLVAGVGGALKEAIEKGYTASGSKLLFEPKGGGDPGYLGILLDSVLACDAIEEVNETAENDDDTLVLFQPEGCHTRGEGQPLNEAMQVAEDRGLWLGHVHFNTGPLAPKKFSDLLAAGTPISKFPPATDPDFNAYPCAIPEWLDDNDKVLKMCAEFSAKTGEPCFVEFDCHAGRGRRIVTTDEERAEITIANIKEMVNPTAKIFSEHLAKVS